MPDEQKAKDDAQVELPADVAAAIALLKANAKEHGEEIVEAFTGTPLYNIPSTRGHAAARGKGDEKLKAASEKIAELEQKVADAGTHQPDVQKMNDTWQKKLDKKDEELAGLRSQLGAVETETIETQLTASLDRTLRPTAAKLMRRELASRVRRTADGKGYELRDADNPDVVVRVPKGKSVFDVLAEEAKTMVEPEDVLSAASGGGGRGNGGGHGGGRVKDAAEIGQEKLAAGIGPRF